MQMRRRTSERHVSLVFFFILQCAVLVVGETCPPAEDISPCVCQEPGVTIDLWVTCRKGDLIDIENAFKHLQGKRIHIMDLTRLKMDRLPSMLFQGLHIENLWFKSCELQGVSDTDEKPAFVGLENSLLSLLIDNSITYPWRITRLNLAHLKNLKKVHLKNNYVPVVDNEWFKDGPISLTQVELDSCGIHTIGDRAFESLPNIYDLTIAHNPLKTLSRTMLPKTANKLQILYLWNCNLNSLPDDMFSDMPNLVYVSLEENNIERLPSTTWSAVWEKLTHVILRDNPLECDEHMEWMFKLKRPAYLVGTCASPGNRTNVTLADLIDGNKN